MNIMTAALMIRSSILYMIVSVTFTVCPGVVGKGVSAIVESYLANGLDHMTSPSGKYAVKRAYGV